MVIRIIELLIILCEGVFGLKPKRDKNVGCLVKRCLFWRNPPKTRSKAILYGVLQIALILSFTSKGVNVAGRVGVTVSVGVAVNVGLTGMGEGLSRFVGVVGLSGVQLERLMASINKLYK